MHWHHGTPHSVFWEWELEKCKNVLLFWGWKSTRENGKIWKSLWAKKRKTLLSMLVHLLIRFVKLVPGDDLGSSNCSCPSQFGNATWMTTVCQRIREDPAIKGLRLHRWRDTPQNGYWSHTGVLLGQVESSLMYSQVLVKGFEAVLTILLFSLLPLFLNSCLLSVRQPHSILNSTCFLFQLVYSFILCIF